MQEKMRIILGVDSITRPLTGIGRYAWELAKRLPGSEELRTAIFFAHGKFISREQLLGIGDESAFNPSRVQWSILSSIRRRLARYHLASSVYGKLMPMVGRMRLHSYSDFLFHSPSYIIPPFDGPSIATIHDLSAFRYPQWQPQSRVSRMNTAIDGTLKRAAHLIADSETVRREIIDYFSWPTEKITAVPLGVDNSFYPLTPDITGPVLGSFGLTHGSYALCIATIEPRKNIDRLIKAFELLPPYLRQNFPLVLVGDIGWNSDVIHKQIDLASRKGWLKYLGYVPESNLPALYSGCRAFLYPSLYEGFGLPLIEAMACGAPVVTSNRSCMPEVAGDAGLLVDPEDVLSIAEGIERVLADEKWRSFAITLGIERTRTMTWDVTAQKTVKVYRQVWDNSNL